MRILFRKKCGKLPSALWSCLVAPVSKFAVFTAAAAGGAVALVVVGVLASAVAVYFYARVIVLMFFTDSPADAPEFRPPSGLTVIAVAVPLAVTLVVGMFPQPVLDLVDAATSFAIR